MSSSLEMELNFGLPFPAEILEDIFLRLDDAADVVRAAAACKSHHQVVCNNRRFLGRYQFLHPPPGFLKSMETGGFLHAQAPHKSTPAATSLAQAADFTFSFLPMEPNTGQPWRVCDARDGRVLLSRRSADNSATFLDLVICDPLYRRYVQIPSISEDLWSRRYSTEMESEPFLLPAASEEEDELPYRVIYNWVSSYKIISFLFDSNTKKWSLATSFDFLPDRLIHDPKNLVRNRHCVGSSRYYVGGCFFWVQRGYKLNPNHMLVLDPLEMKFSLTGLPFPQVHAVVDAGVNRLGVAVLDGNLDLYSKTGQNNGGNAEEWQHDKHIQLPEDYKRHYISGAAEGYLLLGGWHRGALQYFIVDLKTFQVERFCMSVDVVYPALPYARFPSLLSPPSIRNALVPHINRDLLNATGATHLLVAQLV